MRTIILIIFFMAMSMLSKATDLQVYYYYAPFYNESVGTYIETYMTVVGNSIEFKKNENGMFQATLEITMLFKQEGEVKEFKKYNLKSPEIKDTTDKPNFIDLQRITLSQGIYNFEMKIKDMNSENPKDFVFHDIISLTHNTSEIEFSGIEFLEKFTPTQEENALSRNGYDMVPYVADYYPDNVKSFGFYIEIYNTKNVLGEDQDFLLKYFIENVSSKEPNPNMVRTKKQKSAEIIPLLGEFSIDGLETGNYNFVVELRNKENKVIASKKVFFQRYNPALLIDLKKVGDIVIEHTFVEDFTNKDSLIEFIRCLQPIWEASENEYANNAIKSDSIGFMQRYFYGFWKNRNGYDPKGEWEKYKIQVNYVNQIFGTQIKKGYQTDMGRVYLQYGAPNTFVKKHNTAHFYPYEMWHFWSSGNERNIRFVFYNPEITGMEFTLLHSTAKGEIYNDKWFERLVLGDIVNPSFSKKNDPGKESRVERFDERFREVLEDFQK